MAGSAPRTESFPLTYRWDAGQSLPTRIVQPFSPLPSLSPLLAGPDWIPTGPLDQPFDFSGQMRRLVQDVAARCSELKHIDVSRILIGMTQARRKALRGLQARVTPLRFARGQIRRVRRGVEYQVQRYFHGKHEFLYLLTFCLPRFLDQDFDGKLVTVFHELYHISPECDGDLRRHEGRCNLHSNSKRDYDRHMAALAREYLSTQPDPTLFSFLRLTFAQLVHRHGAVSGVVVPRPKIVPLALAARES